MSYPVPVTGLVLKICRVNFAVCFLVLKKLTRSVEEMRKNIQKWSFTQKGSNSPILIFASLVNGGQL